MQLRFIPLFVPLGRRAKSTKCAVQARKVEDPLVAALRRRMVAKTRKAPTKLGEGAKRRKMRTRTKATERLQCKLTKYIIKN